MKIKSAEFITSAFSKEQFIDDLPQIAFAGRSNCGKSTLINTLLNRKKLVKTSSKPGFTKSVNFFLINKLFYFVDLPGFGFAKISKKDKFKWEQLITNYLLNAKNLLGVIHLIDIRRLLTIKDIELINFLNENEIPFLIVLTKADKLSNNEIQKTKKAIKNNYQIDPLIVSALKRKGINELWYQIKLILNLSENESN